jgi:predicted dinucleotide-binding enzyme
MKIGILGAGNIGTILAERLGSAGHDVLIANSRAPETVPQAALTTGAAAVWAADVTTGVDVLIVSVNFGQLPGVAALVNGAPAEAVVIDTSNYHPYRDGVVDAVAAGQVESEWVQEHYGRPIVKAWNTITTWSFANKATRVGDADRVALPVAADDAAQRAIGMALVEQTGFEAFDAGVIADSWRQQPATPAYTTDLTAEQLPDALAAAEASRSPLRRDLFWSVLTERIEAEGHFPGPVRELALARAIF